MDDNTPLNVSIPEAARLCGVGRSTIYKEMECGRLESLKLGKRRLISRVALKKWIESLTVYGTDQDNSRPPRIMPKDPRAVHRGALRE